MTQPAVNMTEIDGALGILPPTAGALLALVGTSTTGPANTPAAFARVSDVVATFGAGPLVEAAAYAITKFGRPVLCVRTGAYTGGSLTEPELTGDGTPTVSVDGSPDPAAAFEFYVEVIHGGALGTPGEGITFQWSLDGGLTMSAETALGTALFFDFPGSGDPAVGNVRLTFGEAAETLVDGDVIEFVGTAPTWSTTPGSLSAATLAGTGSATVDVSGSDPPNDDYEFHVEIVHGGALGVAGITFQWSLDGGRTQSAVTALGTDLTISFLNSGMSSATPVILTLGSALETLVAGDVIAFRGTAPMWDGAGVGVALEALRKCAQLWSIVELVGPMDATLFAAVEDAVSVMPAYGRDRMYIGHARMPSAGESEATYLAALDAIYSSLSTVYGAVCAGSAKMISGVSGRQYRRPPSFWVAPAHAVKSEEVNLANVKVGRMDGVIITDANGNPDDHDESTNPGLDDARFLVLRTWEGRPGVYINRPRMLSTPTSDFQLIPHRRVINLTKTVIRSYLEERVNEDILVDKDTGFILEEEALEIEAGANAALRGALLAKPKASGAQFTLSRTDNLLSTKTLNCSCRVVPLAYPEFIEVEIGFENPAIQARGV